jgi:organic radical activating enzyme
MDTQNTTALPLMEHFCTLQGEGRFTGYAAYFIRLGGCDVGCVWCDVKESWDMSKHPLVPISTIVDWVVASGVDIAVITGGEPLMHDLTSLTSSLKQKGIRVHIETSGAHPLSGQWDWICLSPKKFKAPLKEVIEAAHELKVIVYNKSDFEWAENHSQQVSSNCLLYLQPEWSRATEMNPQIVSYIKSNPKWILSLQTHKYLDIP